MLIHPNLNGQDKINTLLIKLNKAEDDSIKTTLLQELGFEELNLNHPKEAINYAKKALSFNIKRPTSNLILAKAYKKLNQFAISLDYYLQNLKELERTNDNLVISERYFEIGKLYSNWNVHEKALEYYLKCSALKKGFANQDNYVDIGENIAYTYIELKDYKNALEKYFELLKLYQSKNDQRATLSTLFNLSDTYLILDNHQEAIKYNLQILEINRQLNDSLGLVKTYNNIGFLYKYLDKKELALENFQKSIQIDEKLNLEETEIKAITYSNIGTIYQVLNNYKESLAYFNKALEIRIANKDTSKIADTYNNISFIYYNRQKFLKSILYAEKAIELAKVKNDVNILSTSYKTLSDVYQWSNNEKSFFYYKLYASILDSLYIEQLNKQKEILDKRYEVEKKEQELKLLNVDKELNELTINKLQLEKEKKENEVALLLKEKELDQSLFKNQKLAKEKAEQDLLVINQRYLAERKNKEISLLQKDKHIQELALNQKILEQKEKEKAIELLRKEKEILQKNKEIQESNIRKDKKIQNYFLVIIFSIAIILILLTVNYYFAKRSNKKLAFQNKEIQSQRDKIISNNEELQQQRDQILSQRDFIERKNVVLEEQKSKIERSYKNLSVISEIGKEISSTLDFKKNINEIYNHINKLMDATEFGIGIYDQNTNMLDYELYIYKYKPIRGYTMSMDSDRLASWVINNKKSIWINDLENEYQHYISSLDNYIEDELLASLICIPLLVENKVVGIISVQSHEKQAYNEQHLEILNTLSTYISVAVDNSNAYKKLERKVNERTKELKDAFNELIKANQQFDSFSYRSAHDLKGPLARLLGLCYVGQLEVSDPIGIEYLKRLEGTASEMNKMLSRMIRAHEIKDQKVKNNEIDLKKIVDDIVSKISKNEDLNDINIDIHIEEGLKIYSDKDLISIIFENMIQNSVQYRDPDKSDHFVKISARYNKKKQLLLNVKDNGIGISENISEKIFEMFFIGTELSKGPGLGLYEANLIVEKLKGEISLIFSNSSLTKFQILLFQNHDN